MNPVAFAQLLSALCFVESGHNPAAIHFDDGGSSSLGYCQVKLATARELGYRGPVSQLWFDRETNMKYAGLYLRKQIKRYHGDIRKGVSAYNAGHAAGNVTYVNKVFKAWGERR